MINAEQEKQENESLEYESLPEFVREPYTSNKPTYVTAPPVRSERFYERYRKDEMIPTPENQTYPPAYSNEYAAPESGHKSAELETLWPGMSNNGINHHEFLPPTKRSAGMYLTIGFVAGIAATMLVGWVLSFFTHNEPAVSQSNQPGSKKVVVATSTRSGMTHSAPAAAPQTNHKPTTQKTADSDTIPELIIPTVASYQVQNGDTLAGIIMKTYKRVSPRLLDTICRVNGMASADKLTLGQKLNLPEYRPIRTQVATRANNAM